MREIPPTAGLPLRGRDLLPGRARPSLAQWLAGLLQAEAVEVTCSGTAALVVALTALARDSARREVVMPAYTCPLVAMAVRHCGLVTRVCDLDASGLAMDRDQLAAVVGADTLAVVPTYLGGRVHDIGAVLECAQAAGAWVI
ncbi:MAG: DegT/DnrJ/EryC1/StrS aminotransferase family protein, partial [Lysobacter sp.]|nr:DegT/DnrJ/EryC1/StrS aminotransferase family protein [Lysobacter sp.]